jgi:hypothetical protein
MDRAAEIASRVETFVRNVVVPFEKDPRQAAHGPSDELVLELREKARAAGVLTPHIMPGGSHLTQHETALVLRMAGLSPLGPLACNVAAPDEGNMYLAKVAVSEALMRVADRCVQVMGGTGVSRDTIVEQVFREIRAFRIYDGPTEVHKWSLAGKIKRGWQA